jgi:hypothetical protein
MKIGKKINIRDFVGENIFSIDGISVNLYQLGLDLQNSIDVSLRNVCYDINKLWK